MNTAIVSACAMGVLKSHDSNLLQCNGRHIVLTKQWAKYLMERMGLVKRQASMKAKVSLPDFDRLKAQFPFDVKAVIEMEETPPELVINWNQTASIMCLFPVGQW